MIKRDVLILIIAVASGVFAFVLILSSMRGSSGGNLEFVTASQTIAKGQTIQMNNLTLSKPRAQKNANSLFLQLQDVAGTVALDAIPQGALISRSQIIMPARSAISPGEPESVLPLPQRKRALTLSPNEVENIPGALRAGSRVDIMGMTANYEGSKEMQTIVRGVQIIALERSGRSEIRSITAAMSPLAAVMVARATANGKLNLALRPESEGEIPEELAMIGYTEIIRGIEKEKNTNINKVSAG
ncbi:MAG: Flp pilus assembly protein CpaB [Candidatus Omnitrophica bacterium CG1_02_46_14]|nr:MAG: Flp pilus assembly protein CpaB [Candidatus Omnitrophica bacterium CG1_02_46_14]